MDVHPLAELIPPMTDAEYGELLDDIRENGLQVPVTTYEDKILDGRHRYRACTELNVPVKTVAYEGDSPAYYVLSLNVKRRNLTTTQRALIAVEFLPVLEEEARKRMAAGGAKSAPGRKGGSGDPTFLSGTGQQAKSVQLAGQAVGTSGPSVARAKRIKQESPEDFERVKRGEMTVFAASEKLRLANEAAEGRKKPATGKRKADHSRKVVESVVARATNTTLVLSQLDLDAVTQAINEEEAQQWAQQLRTARTALSRLITALETA